MVVAGRPASPARVGTSLEERFSELLLEAGADARSVRLYCSHKGLSAEPVPLRKVGQGISGERVRQLVSRVDAAFVPKIALATSMGAEGLRADLSSVLSLLSRLAPMDDESMVRRLASEGIEAGSACGLVRMADILGVAHGLRVARWTARSKWADAHKSRIAHSTDPERKETIEAVVSAAAEDVFPAFISAARKFSRGSGAVGAEQMAERFSREHGVAVSASEAIAYLSPFSVHLGRHDGEEWFAFLNGVNDLVTKAYARSKLLGSCSLSNLLEYHWRFNRSIYKDDRPAPAEALEALLEACGFSIDGDSVSAEGISCRGYNYRASQVQEEMVRIFEATIAKMPGRKGLKPQEFLLAMTSAGIRESTAQIYMGSRGIFRKEDGMWRLSRPSEGDAQSSSEADRDAVQGAVAA